MNDIQQTQVTDLTDDAVMLDVREGDEWAAGHAANAVHVPLAEVPQNLEQIAALTSEGAALPVVCRRGGRSQKAAEWLAANGLEVINVDGGMTAWHSAGKHMVTENGTEPTVI